MRRPRGAELFSYFQPFGSGNCRCYPHDIIAVRLFGMNVNKCDMYLVLAIFQFGVHAPEPANTIDFAVFKRGHPEVATAPTTR